MTIKSLNPSRNYEVIGEVEASTEQEIKDMVALAHKVQPEWEAMGLSKRIELLKQLFEVLKAHKDELARLTALEMGMPIIEAREDVKSGLEFLDWYCDHAHESLTPEVSFENETEIHTVYREPVGVVAVILAWNFPMSNFVWQCGQNLVAGNAVVLKHSKEVILFSQKLKEIFDQSSLPKGIFNVVLGDGKLGDFLAQQDINLLCFTGSSAIGKKLYQRAAEKFIRVRVELGGSAPGVIFADAKIDEVLDSILINRFLNGGQMCDGLKRLIVHESRKEEVIEKLLEKMKLIKVGEAMDEITLLGPLVNEKQLEILEAQVADAVSKGAEVLLGGKRPQGLQGSYYEPTLLTNISRKMRVWQEEVFGPVLPVTTFSTEAEAIELANDTPYGLGAYVFTEDKKLFERVASQIDSGMVSLNNVSYVKPSNPFGGYKDSGHGREHGKYGFEDLTQVKVVSGTK